MPELFLFIFALGLAYAIACMVAPKRKPRSRHPVSDAWHYGKAPCPPHDWIWVRDENNNRMQICTKCPERPTNET